MIQYMLNITSSSLSSKRNMYFLHVHCTFVRYFSNSPVKNKLKGTPVYQWLLIDLWVGNSEQRKKVCSHFEKQTGFSKGVTPPWVTHSSTWRRRCLTAVASYIAISHLCHVHFLGVDIDVLYLTTTFYRHLARPFLSLWTFLSHLCSPSWVCCCWWRWCSSGRPCVPPPLPQCQCEQAKVQKELRCQRCRRPHHQGQRLEVTGRIHFWTLHCQVGRGTAKQNGCQILILDRGVPSQ